EMEERATPNKKQGPDPLDEIQHGKTVRLHIREFACIFAIIILAIGAYRIRVYGEGLPMLVGAYTAAAALLLLGYRLPRVLYPVWDAWMTFAHYLGMVMTVVLLTVLWIVLVIPLAVGLRVSGK